jgi:hypothetical protein
MGRTYATVLPILFELVIKFGIRPSQERVEAESHSTMSGGGVPEPEAGLALCEICEQQVGDSFFMYSATFPPHRFR